MLAAISTMELFHRSPMFRFPNFPISVSCPPLKATSSMVEASVARTRKLSASIQFRISPRHHPGVCMFAYFAKMVLYSCQGVSLIREKGMVAADVGEGAV